MEDQLKLAAELYRFIDLLGAQITDRTMDRLHEATGGAYHVGTYSIVRDSARSVLLDSVVKMLKSYHDEDDDFHDVP